MEFLVDQLGKPGNLLYDSGMFVQDPRELSTLCVFYETVWLPADVLLFMYWLCEKLNELGQTSFELSEPWCEDQREKKGKGELYKWNARMRLLFDEGVLARLPAHEGYFDVPVKGSSEEKRLTRRLSAGWPLLKAIDTCYRTDMAFHLLRQDIASQDFDCHRMFSMGGQIPLVEVVKLYEARAAFSYVLPLLGTLEPEQIMEVRERVKDSREGFSMHLQKLSGEVYAQLKGEESAEQVAAYARNVVHTQLMPDYKEFRRQLSADKAGFWKNVLDRTGKVFAIDAAPWTPKFWAKLVNALGFSVLSAVQESRENLSNARQALHFLRIVEETAMSGQTGSATSAD